MEEFIDPKWKGDLTAKVFSFGFKFLNEDNGMLDPLSRRDKERFFDYFCALLEGKESGAS
ncbi:hypothetical protein M501DRAFT_1001846 [Patellaria atrata CBS 101060]|uniref:Uncharacterized protein n=1 Tax=Patellaria atrata CBS 101060 TaxID=1346257 RepID=A0A9P4SDW8_9PEZI|nr:hypothetical protein M501DRAFT_1001846 [Patellaria atrata CBS 101060]